MSSVVLMALTMVAVVALFVVLVVYVTRIAHTLERIGGEPTSSLAKIAFGVRAIEVQTAALPPEVGRLNRTLAEIHGGLEAIRDTSGGLIETLGKQRST